MAPTTSQRYSLSASIFGDQRDATITPGCYGFQMNGTSFSDVVVVEVASGYAAAGILSCGIAAYRAGMVRRK